MSKFKTEVLEQTLEVLLNSNQSENTYSSYIILYDTTGIQEIWTRFNQELFF